MGFSFRIVVLTLMMILLAACRPTGQAPPTPAPETYEPSSPTNTPRSVRPGVTPGPTSISRVTPPSQIITPEASQIYATPLPLDVLPTGEPSSGDTSGLFHVQRVRVVTTGARPVAAIEGYFPDGCTTYDHAEQTRTDSTITLTLYTTRPAGAFCTQVIKPFSIDISLDGEFGPGEYTLVVNDVTTTFTLP